jgi:hypothetical protein
MTNPLNTSVEDLLKKLSSASQKDSEELNELLEFFKQQLSIQKIQKEDWEIELARQKAIVLYYYLKKKKQIALDNQALFNLIISILWQLIEEDEKRMEDMINKQTLLPSANQIP